MTASINQKSTKHEWIKYLKELYFDTSLEEKCQEAQVWIQFLDPEITSEYSPVQIRKGIITTWNIWSRYFFSSYPDFYLYLKKRHYFRGAIKFFRLITTERNTSLNSLQALNRQIPIGHLFIALSQLITATIDILEDRKQELIWIKHFLRRDRISRKIVLNIIRRAHPSSFLFQGRIHPSAE